MHSVFDNFSHGKKQGARIARAMRQINPDGKTQFTQKQLCQKWGRGLRSVQRDIRKFGGNPLDYIGLVPVFTIDEVERIEAARKELRAKKGGLSFDDRDGGAGIITIKEAKRRVGKARR